MNCRSQFPKVYRRESAACSGFTLIEIAIALGVIGFALVAIIGILPMGLEVQRDNRSETIINQDANFWMEALRSGALDAGEIPGLVEWIMHTNVFDGTFITNWNSRVAPPGTPANQQFDSVSNIVGLMTWAAGDTDREVWARITAISGAAAEKESDIQKRELAFSYLLRVVVERRNAMDVDLEDLAIPFVAASNEQGVPIQREEHFGYPESTSLYEIRLVFLYPAVQEGRLPPRAQNFRASVSRSITNDPPLSSQFYFRP